MDGGTIQNSYATGSADGGDGNDKGWVAWWVLNDGTISNSYATGSADGGDGDD